MQQPDWKRTKEIVDLDLLQINPDNPKTAKEGEMEELIASLKRDPELMNYMPLHVIEDGEHFMVVDGNHRLMAIRELGWSEVPCEIYGDECRYDDGKINWSKVSERIIRSQEHYVDFDMDKMANLSLDLEPGKIDELHLPNLKSMVFEELNLDDQGEPFENTFARSISFKFEDQTAYNEFRHKFDQCKDKYNEKDDLKAFARMIEDILYPGEKFNR